MGFLVDCFAGGGGASQGMFMATGRHPDIAINHDPVAVAVHALNHAPTRHFCQNIWDVHPAWVTSGHPVDILWASPDCTHHSKAKGGAPIRDRKRRDLAMVIADKWIPALRPHILFLENVEEFAEWGPLDSAGHIVAAAKGQKFREFLNRLRRYGYDIDYKELRACDYGAPTTRNRLYLIARSDGQPIVWPDLTHGAPESPDVLSGKRKPWRTAAECIDWSIPCPSIFASVAEIKAQYGVSARRPLKPATLRRIFRGLEKYVLNHPNPFIIKNYTGVIGQALQSPLGTVTTIDHHALVTPYLTSYYGEKARENGRDRCVSCPLPIQTTENRFGLLIPYIQHAQHDGQENLSRVGGLPSSKPEGGGLVCANMLTIYGRSDAAEMNAPSRTVTSKEHLGIVTSYIGQHREAPHHHAEVRAFLQKYYGEGGQDQPVIRPLDTITTKARFGIVTIYGEECSITDIGMRMLQPHELLLAQGFPETYRLDEGVNGKPTTKAEQVRLIGNSVCPPVAAALIKANYVEARPEEIASSCPVAAAI